MKRQDIVNKLMAEGFSEKTLVNFSDKQLQKLSGMIISEAYTDTATGLKTGAVRINKQTNQDYVNTAKNVTQHGVDVELTEKKSGIVTKKGAVKGKKGTVIGKKVGIVGKKGATIAKKGVAMFKKDIKENKDDLISFNIPEWAASYLINGDASGLEDDDHKKVERFESKVAKKFGNAHFMLGDDEDMDLGFCYRNDIDNLGSNCMRLYIKPNKNEDPIMEWVDKIASKKYTNLTFKKEIMEMVSTKVARHGKKVKMAHNNIPEFMTYESIKKSVKKRQMANSGGGVAEPVTKPAEPVTKPGTRPRPKTPYQPGPGINPRPKAGLKTHKTVKK